MKTRREEGFDFRRIAAAFLASAALIAAPPARGAAAGSPSPARERQALQSYVGSLKARIRSQRAEISRLQHSRSADPAASRSRILAAEKAIRTEQAALEKMTKLERALPAASSAKPAGSASGGASVSGASRHSPAAHSPSRGRGANPTVDPSLLYGNLSNDSVPSRRVRVSSQKRMADGFFAPSHAALKPLSAHASAAGGAPSQSGQSPAASASPSQPSKQSILSRFEQDIKFHASRLRALVGRIESLWKGRSWSSKAVRNRIASDTRAAKREKAILTSLQHAKSIYQLRAAIGSHQQTIKNLKNERTLQGGNPSAKRAIARKIKANEKALQAERRALRSLKPRSKVENLQKDIVFLQAEVQILRQQPSTPYIQAKIGSDLVAIGREQKAVARLQSGSGVSDRSISPAVADLAVVKYAMDQLGKPYIYGGNGPRGYDCSGLVQEAYFSVGIALPRTTYYQVSSGRSVPRPYARNMRPGDLVFIMGSDPMGSLPGHVGMYVGHGTVIQAPYTGTDIQLTPLGDFGSIVAVRRIIGN